MIEFKSVKKIYTGGIMNTCALDDVSFSIDEKEFVSFVGHSGAGKSTILKMIYAEEKPSSGEVLFNGEDITHIKPKGMPLHRRRIGTVFQDYKLLQKKTVFENVAFALEVSGYPNSEIRKSVPQILEIVGLSNKAENYPHEISGGEKQRVAIARSLVNDPLIILADEPTGNLDSINTREIIDLLKKINELGTTVILVTHDRDVVNSLKKRVITIDEGQIIGDQSKGRYVL